MKRILSLVLVMLLITTSLLFTACDREDDEPKDTSASSESASSTEEETKDPHAPVPVDTVKGKTARQLVEDFLKSNPASIDMDLSIQMKNEDGERVESSVSYRVSGSALYLLLEQDEETTELWMTEGTLYINAAGEKLKMSGATPDDLFGEGLWEEMMSSLPTEIPQLYLEKLDQAQIYQNQEQYYFSVIITEAEAEEMEEEFAYTDTWYFSADGKLKRIYERSEEVTLDLLLNSYGEPVTVTLPSDLDCYEEVPAGDVPEGDQETYTTYVTLCQTIGRASRYTMDVSLEAEEGDQLLSYATDGTNQYASVYTDNEYYELWSVDGVGYVAQNNGTPIQCAHNESFLSGFTSVSSLKRHVADTVIPYAQMGELTLLRGSGEQESILSFRYGENATYTFEYDLELGWIAVTVESEEEICSYTFSLIDDPTFRITAPNS